MDGALFASFLTFALAAAFTPGPNNLMLMSSGALFGLRRTWPHILGVLIGFTVVLGASIFGLGALVEQFPWSVRILQIAGGAWLLWLAGQFFRAALSKSTGKDKTAKHRSRPLRFWEAALFQWANPKAVVMAISCAAAYVGLADTPLMRAVIMCGSFVFITLGATILWTAAGHTLARLFMDGRQARILNAVMGVLLLATALIVLTAKA